MDSIPGEIKVEAEENSNLLLISVSSSDAQTAYDILHSVIKNYPDVSKFVFGETHLKILDETGVPSDDGKRVFAYSSYKKGLVQGIAAAMAILAVYVLTRKTVKSKDELKNKIFISRV